MLFKKKKTQEEKDKIKEEAEKKKSKKLTHLDVPTFLPVKPNEGYLFFSDYFKIDDCYATIMNYWHNEASNDGFPAFWGINKIPTGLDDDVVTINFEQVSRLPKSWIDTHQTKSEQVAESNSSTQAYDGTNQGKLKASRATRDLMEIAQELNDGASYLKVHNRILIKAKTLEKLDSTVRLISKRYSESLSTLTAVSSMGEQRRELNDLFMKNDMKKGDFFLFTSTEFAGAYNLVTHGLEDSGGEYVGIMTGDVNNSAVLFDVDMYEKNVVIASEQKDKNYNKARVSDMWGVKVSQAALMNNKKVVHIVLNNMNLDDICPPFKSFTSSINMNKGDVNLFEMFGDSSEELSIFAQQMEKVKIMAEQAYDSENDKTVIRGELQAILETFYIEQGMWRENAKNHRDKLRVVGIAHDEVPKLEMFVSYLDTEYKSALASGIRDENRIKALKILSVVFNGMLTTNGDLFNTTTNSIIDTTAKNNRVIYDFSNLNRRGNGIMMAQLVNVISFAVGNLSDGDVLIFHGTEKLTDNDVKEYVKTQIEKLYENGGRVCFCYNDIDKMIDDRAFNEFEKCDYTIFGSMTGQLVEKYQDVLKQQIPPDLSNLIIKQTDDMNYIRRGFTNVVFNRDLQLFPTARRKKRIRDKILKRR